jgi:hypothetical protein
MRGARLYIDVVEINPPLIIWLDTIPVALGHVLHVSSGVIYNAMTLGLVLASVCCCNSLLRRSLRDAPELRRTVVWALLFALLPLAREDFGEREHLFLALALPYVLLTIQSIGGDDIKPGVSLPVGIAAGIGIALKPYFVTLFVAIEVVAL